MTIPLSDDFYCSQVLSGGLSVERVRETVNVLAFRHTRPSWPIHIVIIPKFHCESLIELCRNHAQIVLEMMNVLVDIVSAVSTEHRGCRLTTNFGHLQTTKHLHWHIYVSNEM